MGEEYFAYEYWYPAAIWKERYVDHYYYRDGRPAEDGGRSDGLFVWLVPRMKRTIALGVLRYSEDDQFGNIPENAADDLEGWHVASNVEDDYTYFSNQPVDITEFLDNPCPVVEPEFDCARRSLVMEDAM